MTDEQLDDLEDEGLRLRSGGLRGSKLQGALLHYAAHVPLLLAEVRRLRGAFEPSLRAVDHARRLRAMQLDIAHAWDLADNDRAALKWALERIAELERAAGAAKALP